MGAWKDFLACFRTVLPLPLHLQEARGKCLVHVSDTPSVFYGDLRRLLEFLEPLCLVHTGDLVDDVKLALRPGYSRIFRNRLRLLAEVMSAVPGDRVAIITGNHDLPEVVRSAFPGVMVFEEGIRLSLCGLDVALAHSLEELPLPPAAFNLFGHDVEVPLDHEGSLYFNGVNGINVILLEGCTVEVLPYPPYVDDARCCRRRTGL